VPSDVATGAGAGSGLTFPLVSDDTSAARLLAGGVPREMGFEAAGSAPRETPFDAGGAPRVTPGAVAGAAAGSSSASSSDGT